MAQKYHPKCVSLIRREGGECFLLDFFRTIPKVNILIHLSQRLPRHFLRLSLKELCLLYIIHWQRETLIITGADLLTHLMEQLGHW